MIRRAAGRELQLESAPVSAPRFVYVGGREFHSIGEQKQAGR